MACAAFSRPGHFHTSRSFQDLALRTLRQRNLQPPVESFNSSDFSLGLRTVLFAGLDPGAPSAFSCPSHAEFGPMLPGLRRGLEGAISTGLRSSRASSRGNRSDWFHPGELWRTSRWETVVLGGTCSPRVPMVELGPFLAASCRVVPTLDQLDKLGVTGSSPVPPTLRETPADGGFRRCEEASPSQASAPNRVIGIAARVYLTKGPRTKHTDQILPTVTVDHTGTANPPYVLSAAPYAPIAVKRRPSRGLRRPIMPPARDRVEGDGCWGRLWPPTPPTH